MTASRPRHGLKPPVDRGETGRLALPNGVEVAYRVRRSGRRTVGLVIERTGELVVTAPRTLPITQVEAVVVEKRDWVVRHLVERPAPPALGPMAYLAGDTILLEGRPATITFDRPAIRLTQAQLDLWSPPAGPARPSGAPVEVIDDHLVLSRKLLQASPQYRRHVIELFIAKEAVRRFPALITAAAQQTGKPVAAIRITHGTLRWGSCSARGVIRLAARLVQAPPEVAEYVIAHEVGHLTHLNHSTRFWRLVERLCPDYRARQRVIRADGWRYELPPAVEP
ncbi:MAG: SprT family zinc-dependent metalloprotease [bacterium]